MPTVSALLRDQGNRPLANAEVELVYFSSGGIAKVQAAGRSAGDGRVALGFAGTVPSPAPRMGLRLRQGTGRRLLSDRPRAVSERAIDFGTVKVGSMEAPVTLATTATSSLTTSTLTTAEPLVVTDTLSLADNVLTTSSSNTTILTDPVPRPPSSGPTLSEQVAALKSEVLDLKRQLAAKDDKIEAVRKAERLEREKQVAERDARIGELEAEVQALRSATEAETNLQDLFENTSQQIEAAVRKLGQRQSPFQLGDVSMELKVLPGAKGTGFSFIPRSELAEASPEVLSKLTLQFNPREQPAPPPPPPLSTPDVVGYARRLAARKLEDAGLSAEFREEVVVETGSGPSKHGRVLRQAPEAGAEIEPGRTVVLTIGRSA